eukprot:TRINITY_DN10191_c0_g1_i2.p1 TRINITY_DN10191_c0_g1~~TRINITY_DN10191_c0_g1_i2.p1  ORF type:complete len:680 (-),score=63.95 TRINITY_DN10191_c0_g1_i2:5-2044(-)
MGCGASAHPLPEPPIQANPPATQPPACPPVDAEHSNVSPAAPPPDEPPSSSQSPAPVDIQYESSVPLAHSQPPVALPSKQPSESGESLGMPTALVSTKTADTGYQFAGQVHPIVPSSSPHHGSHMHDESLDKPAVVMDLGGGSIKAGFSHDSDPAQFASCVGYPKMNQVMGSAGADWYVGEKAQKKRGVLVLKCPPVDAEHSNVSPAAPPPDEPPSSSQSPAPVDIQYESSVPLAHSQPPVALPSKQPSESGESLGMPTALVSTKTADTGYQFAGQVHPIVPSSSPHHGSHMHDESLDKPAVVMDLGGGSIKAGFSHDSDPAQFASCVGYPKMNQVMGSAGADWYVGEKAQKKRGVLVLKWPIEHGVVENWEVMEKIWEHAFEAELGLADLDQSISGVLLSEAPLNPRQNRERMVQIMFDTFNVSRMYVANQAALAILGSGRTTGLVLDSGEGVTHAVPVYEGYSIPYGVQRNDLAGGDLTELLRRTLTERGVDLHTSAEQMTVMRMKEQLCYVAMDFEPELEGFCTEGSYELPDGSSVLLGDEMIRCPELMFNPLVAGKDLPGVHQLVNSSVKKSDSDLQRLLLENILLAGGNSVFRNFPERLQAEVSSLLSSPEADAVRVIAPPDRTLSVWLGGAILTSVSTFARMWICRHSDPFANPPLVGYDEVGSQIVHHMCTT